MKEYIDKEELLQAFEENLKYQEDNGYWQVARDTRLTINKICNFLPADVAPVIHGEWLQVKEPIGWKDFDCVMCSACEDKWIMDEEYDLDFYKEQWIYCHNCGAMMDGGNKQ